MGYSEDDYNRFLVQVRNIQRQSHRKSYWLRLPNDRTEGQIAAAIGCPVAEYSTYLRTFREWGGDATTCGCQDLCNCGKYFATVRGKQAKMTTGSHIPDPYLDPRSGMPGTKPADGTPPLTRYTSRLCPHRRRRKVRLVNTPWQCYFQARRWANLHGTLEQ